MPASPEGVVRLLLSRLTDATLAAVVAGLASACDSRPGCAKLFAVEQRQSIAHAGLPRDESADYKQCAMLERGIRTRIWTALSTVDSHPRRVTMPQG